MTPTEKSLTNKLKLADEALKIMSEFFYPPNYPKTFEAVPDDNGWFYLPKKTVNQFKVKLTKYALTPMPPQK